MLNIMGAFKIAIKTCLQLFHKTTTVAVDAATTQLRTDCDPTKSSGMKKPQS